MLGARTLTVPIKLLFESKMALAVSVKALKGGAGAAPLAPAV